MEYSRFQKDIFKHVKYRDGQSLVVNACAGSGKTTTIVKAASIVSPLADSGFLAFNRHIASELDTRLPAHVGASTFHSLGMRACRANIKPDVVVKKSKYWEIAQQVLGDDPTYGGVFSSLAIVVKLIETSRFCKVKLTGRAFMTLCAAQSIGGVYASNSLAWDEVAQLVKRCLQIGVKQAMKQGVLDFTDMVWLPTFKKWKPANFEVLFIDEAQDLNRLQNAFAMFCLASNARTIAVGDPHQAIYAFMGAMEDSFSVVRETFEAAELPLSVCYRCPTSHLDIARKFCPHILAADTAIEGTVDEISFSSLLTELRGREDALILSRTRAPLVKACIDLMLKGLPATIRGNDVAESCTRLITTLENEYHATHAGFIEATEKYLADQTLKLNSSTLHNINPILERISDDVAAVVSLYEGFPHCRSLSALKAKLRSLFDSKHATVVLTTIHGAKGLESDWVGILNWESLPLDHNFMSDAERAQEVNLQLIATTRSKKDLRFIG